MSYRLNKDIGFALTFEILHKNSISVIVKVKTPMMNKLDGIEYTFPFPTMFQYGAFPPALKQ